MIQLGPFRSQSLLQFVQMSHASFVHLLFQYFPHAVIIREVPIHSSVITRVDSAQDLGVTLDSHLTMSAHVCSMCRSAYCFLRQLCPVVRSLTEDAAKTVVYAFISMRLDYCNSLLCGISGTLYCGVYSPSKMQQHV